MRMKSTQHSVYNVRISSAVDKTQKHYDTLPFRMDFFREKIFLHGLTYPLVISQNPKKQRIIDVGCGTAFVGRWLKEHKSKHMYIGIDLSPDSVSLVNSMGVKAILGNNLKIPLPDSYGDIVVSEGVIHHTPDPHKAFRELVRITKKGGKISLYVYNSRHVYAFAYRYLGFVCRVLYNNRFFRPISDHIVFPIFNIFYVQFANTFIFRNKEFVPKIDAYNIYHDQMLTPIAHFFTDEQIRAWAREFTLTITDFKLSINKQGLLYVFERH